MACDVSGNGSVSALDASMILEAVVGKRTSFPIAAAFGSDWAFFPQPASAPNQQVISPAVSGGAPTPGAIVFDPVAEPAAGQDFSAVPFGDCTGSWAPTGGGAAAVTPPGARTVVRIGPARRGGAGRLRWAVAVRSTEGFSALDLDLHFDPNVVRSVVARPARPVESAVVRAHEVERGHVRVAMASAEALPPRGHTLILEATLLDRSGRSLSPLLRASATVDERSTPLRISSDVPR
jgi:hypothetical protein